jgi:hypothetical protein
MTSAITKSLGQIRKKKRIIGFIGGYLIDDGALTLEELDRGLVKQMNLALHGRPPRLGQVLIELGLITLHELERAVERQARDRASSGASTKGRR